MIVRVVLLLLITVLSAQLHAATRATTPSATQSTTQVASFLPAAREVMEHIQKTYWDPKTGLYVHSTDKPQPEAMWGNGIVFSALVAAARQEPRTYRPILTRFFASLDRYWDAKAPIPGYEPWPTAGNGNDKYYDDNEWMVLTFLEAYDLIGDAKYLNRADQALRFSLSGWDEELGGGIWWHQMHKAGSKNTCANGPAALACARMSQYRRKQQNLDWARKIVSWTNQHLQDSDGLFFDSQKVDTRQINRDKLTYNTALMLRANLALYRATGEQPFLNQALRIGDACDWFVGKQTGAYRDNVRFSHLLVEADLELNRTCGHEKALARARRTGEVIYASWKTKPPPDLIEQASIARMLWLLAEQ